MIVGLVIGVVGSHGAAGPVGSKRIKERTAANCSAMVVSKTVKPGSGRRPARVVVVTEGGGWEVLIVLYLTPPMLPRRSAGAGTLFVSLRYSRPHYFRVPSIRLLAARPRHAHWSALN